MFSDKFSIYRLFFSKANKKMEISTLLNNFCQFLSKIKSKNMKQNIIPMTKDSPGHPAVQQMLNFKGWANS